MRKVNSFFGHALFFIGALKIIFSLLIIVQLFININSIFNGGSYGFGYFPIFSLLIGLTQFIIGAGSILMILLNMTNNPKVIPGYLLGLGALLIELFTPSMLYILVLFAECGMYMKAGSKIIRENSSFEIKSTKTSIKENTNKNTEWFYSAQSSQKAKNEKKISMLEEELKEWKQLLDAGQVDEESYDFETNKLNEKINKLKKLNNNEM